MRVDLVKKIDSSFFTCEKDFNLIMQKLFATSPSISKDLKKLLIINTPDCLDTESASEYNKIVDNYSVDKLKKDGYIRIAPKIRFNEHEEVKSYILITFDNFVPNETNPQYRNCIVSFEVICHTDFWDLGGFRLRPLKIAGCIDGLLNGVKLNGIGTFNFLGANELVLDKNLQGYCLMYAAVNNIEEDKNPQKETLNG